MNANHASTLTLTLSMTAMLVAACNDDGGPCTYDDTVVTAVVTEIGPVDRSGQSSPYVSSLCDPSAEVLVDLISEAGVEQSGWSIGYVSLSIINGENWDVGRELAATLSEQTSGTCTPREVSLERDLRGEADAACLQRYLPGGDLWLTGCPAGIFPDAMIGAQCDGDFSCSDESPCLRWEYACSDGLFTEISETRLDSSLCN